MVMIDAAISMEILTNPLSKARGWVMRMIQISIHMALKAGLNIIQKVAPSSMFR